ncbi:hypothetical protein CQA02_07900 [Klebsiella variicola]|nr:hypothetical protein CQA02_07900 [Klebsiella variicola]
MIRLYNEQSVRSFFLDAKFLYICDRDHARNFMLITCCENENECQAIQRLSKDYQDNRLLIFRIMDHITTHEVNQ